MELQAKISKAITNEDIIFFYKNPISKGQGKVSLERVVREGKLELVDYFWTAGYITNRLNYCLSEYAKVYDKPAMLIYFMDKNVRIDWDKIFNILASQDQYKSMKALIESDKLNTAQISEGLRQLLSHTSDTHDLEEIVNIFKIKLAPGDIMLEAESIKNDEVKSAFLRQVLEKTLNNTVNVKRRAKI